jgi:small-conductance mechanosensitive channel
MMPEQFFGFFVESWNDLRGPGVALQIALIAACTLVGWGLARGLRALISPRSTLPVAVGSFARVLAPTLILILILIARQLLTKSTLHTNLLRIIIPLVASLALMRFGFYVLRRIFVRQAHLGDTLSLFEKLFALVVWSGGILYISGLWPELLQFLDDTLLPMGRHKVSLATILQAAASVLVMLMLALWAGAILEQRLMQMEVVHSSLRVVMARTARALLILVAVLVSLSVVGIDLTVLSVFGGALGVGLGLGMQKIASNYVSGFVILLDRSLKIGDMIAVDKYYGKVTQINARYTVLAGLDGIESVIPNEMLVSGAVQNYSLSDSALRLAVRVTIEYQSDVNFILPLLEQATAKIDRVAEQPPPQGFLLKFNGDGIELEIGFWIRDPENGRSGVVSEVNMALMQVLKEHQITLPTLQREFYILDDRAVTASQGPRPNANPAPVLDPIN